MRKTVEALGRADAEFRQSARFLNPSEEAEPIDIDNARSAALKAVTTTYITRMPACEADIQDAAREWYGRTHDEAREAIVASVNARRMPADRQPDRNRNEAAVPSSAGRLDAAGLRQKAECERTRPMRRSLSPEELKQAAERRRADEERRRAERERSEPENRKRAEYLAKNCQRTSVTNHLSGYCEDSAGRPEPCVQVLPAWRCPDKGPPGMPTGLIEGSPPQQRDRVARSTADALAESVEEGNRRCAEFDKEADAASNKRTGGSLQQDAP